MLTRQRHFVIVAFIVVLGLAGSVCAQPAVDPILRADATTDFELDLAAVVDDLVPLLLEGLETQTVEDAEAAEFFLDLLGVDALDRLRLEGTQKKGHSWSKLTVTLDPDEDGGLLADIFGLPDGECGFAEFLNQDDLTMFSTVQNLPAVLDLMLDLAARPELVEMIGELPVDEDGELSLEGFTPRLDLMPLLSGELDVFMLEMPEGAAMMGPQQMPVFIVIGTHDGPALRDLIFDLAGHFGGDEAMGMTMMLREIAPEIVGDFELVSTPFGGAYAVSEEYLVIGMTGDPLRDLLASPEGDLRVPDGQSWSYMDGEKYGAVMESMMGMATMMAPQEAGPDEWMARMYSVLFQYLESETVHVTSTRERYVVESEVDGELLTGLYQMLHEAMTELPMILEMAKQKQAGDDVRGYISTLDYAMTAWGIDHDGYFPEDPTELVDAGYLDEFPPLFPVPAGQYTEGGYTYHRLHDDEGDIAGYFLFVYGGGEGTGFDVYTGENLADLEDYVIEADGWPDGVMSFCYDGLAVEQWEAWQE